MTVGQGICGIVTLAILVMTAVTIWLLRRRGKPISAVDDVLCPLGFPILALPWVFDLPRVASVTLAVIGWGLLLFGIWRPVGKVLAARIKIDSRRKEG